MAVIAWSAGDRLQSSPFGIWACASTPNGQASRTSDLWRVTTLFYLGAVTMDRLSHVLSLSLHPLSAAGRSRWAADTVTP